MGSERFFGTLERVPKFRKRFLEPEQGILKKLSQSITATWRIRLWLVSEWDDDARDSSSGLPLKSVDVLRANVA